MFAAAAVVLGLGASAVGLLATDIYLHWRVQDLGAVNIWGYRGQPVGAKAPGEFRIVVLGGSTAFGYGLPSHESFPHYLEKLLNRRTTALRRFRVVNLGAPGQGAYGFRFDLDDFAYLRYDAVIFYSGYNDLGIRDVPDAVPTRAGPNYFLWRRQSPVFRLTGYFPVLPLVFREKAMKLRAGDLDAAYRGRVTFKPGLAARTTAAALVSAASVADAVGTQLGRLTSDPMTAAKGAFGPVDDWVHYTTSVTSAVARARERGAKVLVVTQPYASDSHVAQQRALAAALEAQFGADAGVGYANLGAAVDLKDRALAYDGLHLVARANEIVATRLVEPMLRLAQ